MQLYERMIVLGLGVTLVAALLYIAGNYQSFADETQEALLAGMQTISAIVVVATGLAVAAEVVLLNMQRRFGRLRTILWLILVFVVSGSILLGSTGIIVLQQPL